MKLSDLLKYKDIVIQCHDNPDADALASGYAVHTYLKEQGITARFVYGGRGAVRKSNLVLMIKELDIPVEYVEELDSPELLLTIDCQYGEGNVTRFEGEKIAVLDHHRISGMLPAMSEVRNSLGACSTLIWEMLKEEGYDVNQNAKLATALYYGLYTDTNEFTELYHPLDKDLRDSAKFIPMVINKFRNANLSIEELEVAGAALLRTDYIEEYRLAIVKAAPCDPNVLGIISDMVLEVDAVDVVLVFNVNSYGVKLSIRSCVKEVQASELAEEICKGLGSGGGHHMKAGGFLEMSRMIPEYEKFCREKGIEPRMVKAPEKEYERPSDSGIKAVLERRLVNYFEYSQIIVARDAELDEEEMDVYIRRQLPIGYVNATDIFEAGTCITLRTMQGDLDTVVKPDTMILIGIKGEVSLMREESFMNRYRVYDWPYSLRHAEYNPTVKENPSGVSIPLMQFAKVCIPTGKTVVQAKQISNNVKLFTEWDETKYMKGHPGDYLIQRSDDYRDITTMERMLFEECYIKQSLLGNDMVDLVIFDLDGTLLDTLQDLTNAVNFALTSVGLPPRTKDEVRRFVGNGVENLMAKAVPDGRENALFDETFRLFKNYYGEHYHDCTVPYENMVELMQEIRIRDNHIAVLSNKPDAQVKALCKEYFGNLVEYAVGERDGIPRKPDPAGIQEILSAMEIPAERALYIGDSEVDIALAENASVRAASVSWGFKDAAFLKNHGAQVVVDTPIELLFLM